MNLILCSAAITFREALSTLLEAKGLHVQAVASTPGSALKMAVHHGVDVCIVDCEEVDEAPQAVADVATGPAQVVALISPSFGDEDEAGLRAAGAAACISKGRGADEVISQLEALMSRSRRTHAAHPRRREGQPSASRGELAHPSPGSVKLTPREREVLQGLLEGCSTQELAARLGVRPATARKHIEHLLAKLNVHSRSAAVTYAIRSGLVSL